MRIIILNYCFQSIQKMLLDFNTEEPVFFFDNEQALLQFQFLQDERSLLYLFCDHVDESVRKTVNRLRQYIPQAYITIVSKSRDYEQVRYAFLSNAHDYLAFEQMQDLQLHIKNHSHPSTCESLLTPQDFFETIRDRHILEGRFVEELISGSTNNIYISKTKQFHLENYTNYFIITIMLDTVLDDIMRDNYDDYLRNLLDILLHYIEENSFAYLQSLRILFLKQENSVCMLCCNADKDKCDFQGDISVFFGKMLNRFQHHTSYTFTMGISNLFNDLLLTREAYIQAKHMGDKRFYGGSGQLYFYESTPFFQVNVDVEAIKDIKSQINMALESGNQTMLIRSCEDLCSFIKRKHMNREDALMQLTTMSNNFVLSSNEYSYSLSEDLKTYLQKVEKIQRLSNFEQMKDYFLEYIVGGVTFHNTDGLYNDIHRVLQIIDAKYADDITLESMAELLHFNPSYFSVWFKKEVGINFSSYLRNKRLEAAKMMLIYSDKSIQQISLEVGYKATISFNRVCKSYFSMTPSQIRKQCLSKAQINCMNEN